MKCDNCGAELKKVDDQFVCAYCGSVYHPDEPEYDDEDELDDDDDFEDDEEEEEDVDYDDEAEPTPAPQDNRQENSGKPALISFLIFIGCFVMVGVSNSFALGVIGIIIGGIAMCAFAVTFIQFVFRGFRNLF
jgi:hypothetical protein